MSREHMVIVGVMGGLGNQMFQYAFGRNLEVTSRTSVYYDVSIYDRASVHQGLELENVFGLRLKRATPSQIRSVVGRSPRSLTFKAARRFSDWLPIGATLVTHRQGQIRQRIAGSPAAYATGYWQSPYYFSGVTDLLRKDFTFRLPLSPENARLLDHVRSVNSVGVHVRRGDYANNKRALAFHGLCSIDYYRDAARAIDERTKGATYFIFSDDLGWAESNFVFLGDRLVIVANNRGPESYLDMRMMSECRHNIIANSTFSWWAAWLNQTPGKIVAAPKHWYVDPRRAFDTILPHDWLKL